MSPPPLKKTKQESISSFFKLKNLNTSNNVTVDNVDINVNEDDTSESAEHINESATQVNEPEGECAEQSDCQCCLNPEVPSQPDKDHFDYGQTRTLCGKKKPQARYFDPKWFSEFPWLTFCVKRLKVFCLHCRWAKRRRSTATGVKDDSSFTNSGFSNWNRTRETFRLHEKSRAHANCTYAWLAREQSTVAEQLNFALSASHRKRQNGLLKTVTTVQTLARQGMPIRGHNDTDSNIRQFLLLRAQDDENLKEYIDQNKYMSHETINELLTLLGDEVLRDVIKDVSSGKYFALIADESRDISGHEQFSISLRHVSEEFEINEDFIGFIDVPETSSASLLAAIKDALTRCNLDINNCRGQAYDGAANMSGHLSGVAKRIKYIVPNALSVHCLNHNLQLCVQEVAAASRPIQDALGLCTEIHNIIKMSPKRLNIFEKIQSEFSDPADPESAIKSIKPLCATRWTVKSGAVTSILDNYSILQSTLNILLENCPRNDVAAKVRGVQAGMQRFSALFGLLLSKAVFGVTDTVSRCLQAKSMDALTARQLVGALKAQLQHMRQGFDAFWVMAEDTATSIGIPVEAPKQHRRSRKVDKAGTQAVFHTPADFYRRQYYECIDVVSGELDRRFENGDIKVLQSIEEVVLAFANGDSENTVHQALLQHIGKTYHGDVDLVKLQHELPMLTNVVRTYNAQCGENIKAVTSLSTLATIFNRLPFTKLMLPEIVALLKLYFTVPMTSCTAERSFSSLRRLKSYLRQTMTQKTLNAVALTSIHTNRTDSVDPRKIMELFISKNDRREAFFGRVQQL